MGGGPPGGSIGVRGTSRGRPRVGGRSRARGAGIQRRHEPRGMRARSGLGGVGCAFRGLYNAVGGTKRGGRFLAIFLACRGRRQTFRTIGGRLYRLLRILGPGGLRTGIAFKFDSPS